MVGQALATRIVLLAALLARPAVAQTAASPRPSPVPIVVFQFTSAPADQAFAAGIGRLLVRALIAEGRFEVMSRPRSADGGRNARYAVVGQVAASGHTSRVTVQLLEIDRVTVIGRDTVMVGDPDAAVDYLVRRFQEHLSRQQP